MTGVLLVVAGEAALLHQPAEAAFDDPTPWQHDEAFLIFELFDDAQREARTVTEEAAHVLHEDFEFPCIATIREDHQQAQQAVAEQAQQQLRAIAVLHACWRDHHTKQQAVGVGERMALAPFDLLARVIAAAYSR